LILHSAIGATDASKVGLGLGQKPDDHSHHAVECYIGSGQVQAGGSVNNKPGDQCSVLQPTCQLSGCKGSCLCLQPEGIARPYIESLPVQARQGGWTHVDINAPHSSACRGSPDCNYINLQQPDAGKEST
jgi:hypothetical protein